MASTTPSIDGILSGYDNSKTSSNDRLGTDKNTFLKLLIAQLTNQDPLNPSDDTEFISQLAQFTLVEEMQSANEGINNLADAQMRQQLVSAASLLDKLVSATGDNITKLNGVSSEIYADFTEAISSGLINVYAANADGTSGSLVYSLELGPVAAGLYPYQWNGQDNNGNTMPDGNYFVVVTGVNNAGNQIFVDMTSFGIVKQVETSPDGNHYLYLNDGRTVRYDNVLQVSDYVTKDPEPTEEEKKAAEEAEAAAAKKLEEEAEIRKLILDKYGSQDGDGDEDGDGDGDGTGDGSGTTP